MERIVALACEAEAAIFSYGWWFDSHILRQDPYPLLTLMAANARRMRFGTCVTNPAVRDVTVTASLYATLHRICGRAHGPGHRAQRQLPSGDGKKADDARRLEETVRLVRERTAGRPVLCDGQPIQMTRATARMPPVWVAGYGADPCARADGSPRTLFCHSPILI
ncbi:MAG TPA: LLM class flavin-dependent oxidoreductase [Blastocatellia bacterium]|nr:LLM class flavin-dependent oxidoreductase [Blastocatellia bacterium]